MHSCILSSWENGFLLTKQFILEGRLFHSPARIACAKACLSHCCEVNISYKLPHNFSDLLRFREKEFFRKSLEKSEQSDRFQPGKILKIIEHFSYSIMYCKTSLLKYLGSNSLSNAGPIFDSTGRINLSLHS